jgi:HmuY protein
MVVFMYKSAIFVTLTLAVFLSAGCSSEPDKAPTPPPPPGPMCMATTPIACEDQVVQQMDLKNNVAPGLVTDAPDGEGFRSTIDATAGGFMYTDSYVYAKFTDKGLVKVDLTDEDSLTSMDWDIAFRRFVVRINSGNSGPSCVKVAQLTGTSYEGVMSAPASTSFRGDEYFSESCTLFTEDSGLGSPATALHGFWDYPKSCVQMSGDVYVLQKADGSMVKLTITDYYEPTAQEQCNTTGAVPMGTPGAMIRMRWALLP